MKIVNARLRDILYIIKNTKIKKININDQSVYESEYQQDGIRMIDSILTCVDSCDNGVHTKFKSVEIEFAEFCGYMED